MKRIISAILCLSLVLSMGLAGAVSIETAGTASVKLAPDTVQLSLGVRAFNSDVTQAMSTVNECLESITSALGEAGVPADNITADGIYIYSNFDYDTGVSTGYNVSRQIGVTINDVAKAGSFIDVALSSGADELSGLTFSSSKQREAYDEAMAMAVKDARKRAEIIAAAEGLTLVSLISLKEADSWSGVRFEDAAGDSAQYTSTELDVGSLNVQATINAVYEAE